MSFESILFPEGKDKTTRKDAPACLFDLHLDQFFHYISDNKYQYDLNEYYYTELKDMDTILYRQEILKDLLHESLRKTISIFSIHTGLIKKEMDNLRNIFQMKPGEHNNYLSRGRMLYYALVYVKSIRELIENLSGEEIHSQGLKSFTEYLKNYSMSQEFLNLENEAKAVRSEMDSIDYCLYIKSDMMRIIKYNNEENLTDEITSLFEKFRADAAKDYTKKLKDDTQDNRIEIQVTNYLAKMFSKEFKHLDTFVHDFVHFDNDVLLSFSREVQFYLGWIEETKSIREAGLSFSFPSFSPKGEAHGIYGFFDLMLAAKQPYKIVTNDIEVKKDEHILVITGPNQGGKTTYARAYGQVHYLASLGLDVPGTSVTVPLTESVLTHFEKEESIDTLNGKLQDELERLYAVKQAATRGSLIIINEIFASTTTADAIVLGHHMVDWLKDLGAEAIVVTFLDELASEKGTVSLMCGIIGEDNHERTYKIIRKDADGHAYAMDIAKKYGLTREELKRRLTK